MRTLVIVVAIVLGVVVVSGVAAATGNGRDHSGETVRAARWADDVCGTVGAWEGQLEATRDDLKENRFGLRSSDGGSGDSVERTVTLRSSVDRAILATEETLQEGLKRAGVPDANQGEQASLILRSWAQQTETNLRVAQQVLKRKPPSTSGAFAALLAPANALARSAVEGRAAFKQVAALDPALSDALDASRHCRDLMKDEP